MKLDRIVAGLCESDVEILVSTILRDHLTCECVDHRNVDKHTDHLAKIVLECIRAEGHNDDPDYIEFANSIINKER